jgi:hypothetical protein
MIWMHFSLVTWAVLIGKLVSFLARLRMLQNDYRQYTTHSIWH